MVWLEKLKLNKQLSRTVTDEGLTDPKTVQLKTLARISGGQDVIAIAPEGSGKTTTTVLCALNKFRQGYEDAPRVLILVPDKEQVEHYLALLSRFNKNKTIKIIGLYATAGLEAQLDALADGADIVVATPDRARAIYLKLALDLNKIQLLVIDDADLIVKQGLQLPVTELSNSIGKCQRVVFTEVMHAKLEKMVAPFMNNPATVEVDIADETQARLNTYDQLVYQVPNTATKLNLLNLFVEDAELFTKVAVLVNTPFTADKVYQSFKKQVKNEATLYKQQAEEANTAHSMAEFIDGGQRVLIALNSAFANEDTAKLPFVIYFDLPEERDLYLQQAVNQQPEQEQDKMLLALVTDLELNSIRKIEQAIGSKIPVGELPENLRIEEGSTNKPKKITTTEEPEKGAAFHTKKPSNAKNYNYSSGEKARMNKKKKYG